MTTLRGARSPTLTPRELEVLRLMIRGQSSRQIAETLEISQKTARNHIDHILVCLAVHNRIQAVVTALQREIVSFPAEEP